jgi:16S rRNA processing protein RimM
LKHVRLDKDGASRLAEVERVWLHNGRPILKFVGVDSISDAEKLEGADVLVEEADRELPAEGEYSHEDLIGCTLLSEESDQAVGVVRSVEDYGGPPVLKLEAPDGREILVPFARAICREIDVARKMIRARLPEGLTEL